tara:strand:- start:65 stop:328 length:264 start_codon:yes stop_codon:yes gene_type:complete
MKVRKLLELQSTIEESVTPCDMNYDDLNKHYSESKDKEIDILDMDLIHLVRSYSKCIDKIGYKKEIVREKLDNILKQTHDTINLLDE